MAKLTENTNWTGSFTITSGSGKTVTLDTNEKYVARDIAITMVPQSATPAFDGGGVTGSVTAAYTNATTSTSDTSGVKVDASAKYSRAAVLYNGAVNGWVNKANDAATGINAISNQALTANPDTKYITGVTIGNSKNFDITIPNGGLQLTLNFAVDGSGNVVVT